MLDVVAAAAAAAWRVHRDQVDKSGAPYLAHVARVAARVARAGPQVEAVAWLHDAVEGGVISLHDLASLGFDPEIVEAVDALSRRLDESDAAYLERVLQSRLARVVKRADVADNSDLTRLHRLDEPTRVRLDARYRQMREGLGALSHVDPSTFASLGCTDLAWIGDWASDPIELYESHAAAVATRAIQLVREGCLNQALVAPILRANLSATMRLEGLCHRVKSPQSTADRLDRSLNEIKVAEDPKDVVRFTVIVDQPSMWDEADALCSALARDLLPIRARSFFVAGNPYYGLHTWWQGIDQLMVEIQIHTELSFRIKEETHHLYETYRDPDVVTETRFAAWRERVAAWADYEIPPNRPLQLAGITLNERLFVAPSGTRFVVRSIPLPR